jgi:polygalacturonase
MTVPDYGYQTTSICRLVSMTLLSAILAASGGGGGGTAGATPGPGNATSSAQSGGSGTNGTDTTIPARGGGTPDTSGATTQTGSLETTGTAGGTAPTGGTNGTVAQVPVQASSVRTQWGTVNEPSLPNSVCATLSASITPAAGGSIDAVDADPTKSNPDTLRIQNAIDACPAGQAVKLVKDATGAAGFLSAPLTLKSGVTLWLDSGVTLYASRNPADFDKAPGKCGTVTTTQGCKDFILATNTVGSGIVGDGIIDGRAGSRLTTGSNAGVRSWWDIAMGNKQGELSQSVFALLAAQGGSNFTLYKVALVNSPNVHIAPSDITGLTLWGVKIVSPTIEYSMPGYACPAGTTPDVLTPATCFTPDTVKNTDGFDPQRSSNVLLAYSYISVGDDAVAVKAHSATRPLTNLAFLHNHLYYGHGMSIGSETDAGVSNMIVDDLSVDGYDSSNGSGLHIKSDSSRGGHIDNVTYSNVCMRNIRYPLAFDSYYRAADSGKSYPWYTNITIRNVHMVGSAKYGGGQLEFTGFKYGSVTYPMTITLDNVVLDGPAVWSAGRNGAPDPEVGAVHFTLGPGAVSFSSLIIPSAINDITVAGTPGTSTPLDCSKAFIPLKSVLSSSPI